MVDKNIIFNNKNIIFNVLFKTDDIDVDKILISKRSLMVKNSLKYFIVNEDHYYIGCLCIKLPQIN